MEEYNNNWNRSSIRLLNRVKGQRVVEKVGKEQQQKGIEIDQIISSTNQLFSVRSKEKKPSLHQFDFGRGELERQQ